MQKLLDNISELFKPSSVFALIVYGVFALQAIRGKIDNNVVENAFLILMAFYFGKKAGENGGVK